ncbi:MAG: enoyl-CoA hydratase/isomerase family protein [Myxococcota bacterium]
MDYDEILYEVRDGVALITLNRPERRNAWTPRMDVEKYDAVCRANDDPAVGAIVVTGAGKGFCAGADMGTFDAQLEGEDRVETGGDWTALVRASKPMVAAVNGASVGVGLTMILPFDVIVASEHARFGMFFIRMGIVPELASTHFLVQRMGFGRASEMCLSGRLYDADEAFASGLADHRVEAGALLPRSIEIAASMGVNPPPQLRWIKELLTANGSETDIGLVQRREMQRLHEAYETPEHREAVKAFLEKRAPDFRRG